MDNYYSKIGLVFLLSFLALLANPALTSATNEGKSIQFLKVSSENNFLDEQKINREINEFLSDKNTAAIPEVNLTAYKQSSLKNVLDSIAKYDEVKREKEFKGFLIFYFSGDTILAKSYTERISNLDLHDSIINKAEAEVKKGLSDEQVIIRLIKRYTAKFIDSEEGEPCKIACGSNLNCEPTFLGVKLEKACCPQGQRWSGQQCKPIEEGVKCTNDKFCGPDMSCNSNSPRIEERCCPQGLIWDGAGCRKAIERENCEGGIKCKKGLTCNPTFSKTPYDRACCPPGEMLESSKSNPYRPGVVGCRPKRTGEKCKSETYCKRGQECNPTLPGAENEMACCPLGRRWDGSKCTLLQGGEKCDEDGDCGMGLECNPTLSGSNLKEACCPHGERWDGTECRAKKEGAKCGAGSKCPDGLNCNPTIGNKDQKVCCPPGEKWDGKTCRSLKPGDPCTSDKYCKLGQYCYSTIENSEIDKSCCPQGQRWNGEQCINSKLGNSCEKSKECGPALECYKTIEGAIKEKACCPQSLKWDGDECRKRKTGEYCEDGLFCKLGQLCSTTLKRVKKERACCWAELQGFGYKRMHWTGERCVRTYKNEYKGDKGDKCLNNGDCKQDLKCFKTFPQAQFNKICCPQGKRWDGTECKELEKKERGETCLIDDQCKKPPLSSMKIPCKEPIDGTGPKGCCRKNKVWTGEQCAHPRNGDACQDHLECTIGFVQGKPPYLCLTTIGSSQLEKACCPNWKHWNGSSCTLLGKGKACRRSGECKQGLKCNPLFPYSKKKACCPEGKRWDEDSQKCKVPGKGRECKNDYDCLEASETYETYLNCNLALEGSVSEKACCPQDKIWDGTHCIIVDKGERCVSDDSCKGDLNCNKGTVEYIQTKKFCCPGNKAWNGEKCAVKKTGKGCLQFTEKGPGIPVKIVPIQKYEDSSDFLTVDSQVVKNKVAAALAQYANRYKLGSPKELTYQQRSQAIYSWVMDKMHYFCDSPYGSCGANPDDCKTTQICECRDKFSCDLIRKGDIFQSAEGILTETSKCCKSENSQYFGDCDDYATLYTTMLRAAGVSEDCVTSSFSRAHAFNSLNIKGKWRYADITMGDIYMTSLVSPEAIYYTWKGLMNLIKKGEVISEFEFQTRYLKKGCITGLNDYTRVGRCATKS